MGLYTEEPAGGMPEWLKKMGANASNYPHSCSPRVGGNSQAQQTFIGNSLQFSCHLHNDLLDCVCTGYDLLAVVLCRAFIF